MPRRATRFTAVCRTVSVVRPRKSNFTSPACSTHFMLNWVTGSCDFGSRYIGTSSESGRSPITMPAACVEAWRCRPSSFIAISKARLTTGSASRAACRRGSSAIAFESVTGAAGLYRHQLGELVDLPVGHFEHAPDIAQHAAGLQRAEGDDLRHLIAPVALLHVVDHLVAPLLAEIDVEVRHRHALRIEEALEQETEADRIEVGDGERVGDERARARAAARAHRNAASTSPHLMKSATIRK